MKLLSTKAALIAGSAFCLSMTAYAQTANPKYELGVNIGLLVYQGDLTPEKLGSFKTMKFSFGLHASRIFSSSFSLKGHLAFGKLKGDDAKYANPAYRQLRNFNFTSPVVEFSGQLVWNVTGKNYADKGFSPYLFAGAGLSFLKIKRDWSNINTTYFSSETSEIWAGLAADSAHKLPGVIPVIPIGAGIKYFFTPDWAINAESSFRITTTDYLDGFSKAANPTKRDSYYTHSIGLIYRPDKMNKLGCPVMNY
jgi:hypothetical protein